MAESPERIPIGWIERVMMVEQIWRPIPMSYPLAQTFIGTPPAAFEQTCQELRIAPFHLQARQAALAGLLNVARR